MNVHQWYVIFHKPEMKSPRKWFGHVGVCGYTLDNTWFFMDPTFDGFDLDIVHRHETVERYLECAFGDNLVLKIRNRRPMKFHLLPMMNCATIIAYMLGHRAFTPWGLKRKLLRNGAEVIHDGRKQQQ